MAHYRMYTDGSFCDGSDITHGGIVFDGDNQYKVHLYSRDPKFVSMRNVGGEVLAAWLAVFVAVENIKQEMKTSEGLQHHVVELVYDYNGVGCWLNGQWKCNKEGTAWYRDTIQKMISDVGCIELKLIHVKGHGTNEGNIEADKVANFNMEYAKSNGIQIIDIDEIISKYT